MDRPIFTEEHDAFRSMVARFVADEVLPYHDAWEDDGLVPRELWKQAGGLGLLCTDVPIEYGGGGIRDFRYNSVVTEELARVGASGSASRCTTTSSSGTCWLTPVTTSASGGCRAWPAVSSSRRSR